MPFKRYRGPPRSCTRVAMHENVVVGTRSIITASSGWHPPRRSGSRPTLPTFRNCAASPGGVRCIVTSYVQRGQIRSLAMNSGIRTTPPSGRLQGELSSSDLLNRAGVLRGMSSDGRSQYEMQTLLIFVYGRLSRFSRDQERQADLRSAWYSNPSENDDNQFQIHPRHHQDRSQHNRGSGPVAALEQQGLV